MEINGSADRENRGEVPHPGERLAARPSLLLNKNHYANKKSAAESMLDVALLMANASQLKAVLEQGPDFSLYTPLITLISISLSLQVTVGVLLIFIGEEDRCLAPWGTSVCNASVFQVASNRPTQHHFMRDPWNGLDSCNTSPAQRQIFMRGLLTCFFFVCNVPRARLSLPLPCDNSHLALC
uniref:Ninjurin 1 n=1 Tax=Esox lucius TaxID=8010 RepID=A0AAY5K3X9_ESOLU